MWNCSELQESDLKKVNARQAEQVQRLQAGNHTSLEANTGLRAAAPAERPRGLGIGLVLTQVLAQLHGEEIEIESQPGAGTHGSVMAPSE